MLKYLFILLLCGCASGLPVTGDTQAGVDLPVQVHNTPDKIIIKKNSGDVSVKIRIEKIYGDTSYIRNFNGDTLYYKYKTDTINF